MPLPQPRGSIATNRPYPCRGLDLCLTGCEGYVLDATAMIEHVVLVALFLGGAPNDRFAFKMSTMAQMHRARRDVESALRRREGRMQSGVAS